MIELKKGDMVEINGEVVEIVGFWGQGTYKVFRLTDDRTMDSLDEHVTSGAAKLVGNSLSGATSGAAKLASGSSGKVAVKKTDQPVPRAVPKKSNFTPVDEDLPILKREDIQYGEDLED
jgi:hypothetical protein